MKSKVIIILAWLGLFTLSGCDDFLEQTNTTNPNADTFFDSDETVRAATAPLYNVVWYNFNEKFYYGMGDGRSNNISAQWSSYIKDYTNFNETSQTEGLEDAWGSLYSVVAQSCNTISNIKDKSTAGVSESAKLEGLAEARFMRGVAYWYIGSLWGDAILYERTSDLASNFVIPASRQADVMEFAIRDLEYAARYLPRTSTAKGRVNRYSAFGMLSRVYLSMAGLTGNGAYNGSNIADDHNRGSRNEYYLDLARKAAMKVVNESSFELMDNYGDLFTYENNNCKEAMFQLQWLAGSNSSLQWGTTNPIQAFFGWSTMVADATNWGNATYASWDLVDTYDPEDVIRRHATICVYGDEYPELYKKGGGYVYGITEEGYTEKCNIKKYVIGTNDDNGVSYQQSNGLNTHMLRLAEVYLNLAEATLGNNASTTDATARTYFNKVRKRAGMPEKATDEPITAQDINYERRIELAMEGQYWYDLLRRGYYEQDKVVQYLNSQNRNAGYQYIEGTAPNDGIKMYEFLSEGTGVFPATARHLLLPISDTDKGKNKYLDTANYPAEAYEFDPEDKITDLYN
jgi:hypothetical protein